MPMYNNYPYQMQQMPQQMPTATETLIPVQSDEEVIRYPIAPGNSLSFRNITQPYIYSKTLLSQFAQPVVKKYRLVEETAQNAKPEPQYALRSDLEALAAQVAKLLKVTEDE